jgi:hypothetical protein
VANLLDPAINGRPDQKIHTLALLTNYDLVLQGRIARAQELLEAPAPAPNANAAGQDAGAGGVGAPLVGVAPAAPPDPKELQASIQYMQKLEVQFTGTIRSALRDPSPMVRYWAQAKLAQIADPGSREKTAQTMMQGKDWQERVLGLILANDVPRERGKALAEALKADPVPYVKDFADATIELAASSPTTRPTTAP